MQFVGRFIHDFVLTCATAQVRKPEEKVKPVQDENAKPTPEQNDLKTVVAHPVSDSDRKILQDMIGTAVADQLIELDESIQARKPSGATPVKFPQITDRQKRGAIHQVQDTLI